MKEYGWVCTKNIALIILTGFALWLLQSGWVLLALVFLTAYKPDHCPKCGHIFSEDEL